MYNHQKSHLNYNFPENHELACLKEMHWIFFWSLRLPKSWTQSPNCFIFLEKRKQNLFFSLVTTNIPSSYGSTSNGNSKSTDPSAATQTTTRREVTSSPGVTTTASGTDDNTASGGMLKGLKIWRGKLYMGPKILGESSKGRAKIWKTVNNLKTQWILALKNQIFIWKFKKCN